MNNSTKYLSQFTYFQTNSQKIHHFYAQEQIWNNKYQETI